MEAICLGFDGVLALERSAIVSVSPKVEIPCQLMSMQIARLCGGGGELGCKAAKEWICGFLEALR